MKSMHIPGNPDQDEITNRLRRWFRENLPPIEKHLRELGGLPPPHSEKVLRRLKAMAPIAIKRLRRRRAQEIISSMPEAAQKTIRDMEAEGAVFEADDHGALVVIGGIPDGDAVATITPKQPA